MAASLMMMAPRHRQQVRVQRAMPGWPLCKISTIDSKLFADTRSIDGPATVSSVVHGRQTPLVMSGMPASERWAGEMSVAKLLEQVPSSTATAGLTTTLGGVYVQSSNETLFFNHDKEAKLAAHLNDSSVPAAQKQRHREEARFLSDVLRHRSADKLYWSGKFDDLGLLGATRGVTEEDIAALSPVAATPGSAEAVGKVHTRMWIATGGVQAALHYDVYHNVLVQIAGTKRVWLLPPSELPNLRMYPSLHPRYRHSQLPAEGAAPAASPPHACDVYANVQHVDLQPGQALYIPPFWSHSVETFQTLPPQREQEQQPGQQDAPAVSISINMWALDAGRSKSLSNRESPQED